MTMTVLPERLMPVGVGEMEGWMKGIVVEM